MRAAAAVLLVAFSAACTEPDVPKYELNPGAPTIQIPTTIRLSVLQGTGTNAKNAYVTASLRDQQGRGIADRLLAFSTSKGTIEPGIAKTNVDGEAKATVTHGSEVTVSVSGAGLTASMDVALTASLSVSLSASRAEKNVPVTLTANVNGDASAPLRFAWNFGDGKTAETATATVTHTWADDGPVKIEVSVTDAIDRRGTASLSLVVRDNPEPPPEPAPPPAPSIQVTVSASPSPAIAGQPTTVKAVATPQHDAPPVTSFEWDCLDDKMFEGMTAGNTFVCTYAAGNHTARVRAHGGTVTGEGTVAITVQDAPLFISLAVISPLGAVHVNVPSTFEATVTVAPPATVPTGLQFYWDEGTGSFGAVTASNTRAITLHSTGAATIKVKVVDPLSGREATNSLNVTVVP